MGLDLLMLHPCTRKRVYQVLADDHSAREPPYLAAMTADFVRRRGFNVKILDADAENLSVEETVDAVKEYDPNFVHIVVHGQQPSASTQLMGGVGEICKAFKVSGVRSEILLTGTHPSALPERTLREEKCDYVGRGEGFFTILGLLERNALSEIPGLWYRDEDNGKGVVRGKADLLIGNEKMDSILRGAAWDQLPMDKYRAHGWHAFKNMNDRQPYASIYTSFGCGMGCEFCCIDSPFTDGGERKARIRFRGVENVVNEIEILNREYGVKNLKIIDEMFVFNQEHYLGVANELIKRGLGNDLNMWAYARIDTVKEGNLGTLRKAGFHYLGLGIESGSAHVRAGAVKQIKEDKIHNIVQKIKDAGIYPACNYIFGLEDDTLETMKQTLDLAVELNGVMSNFYSAMAYPGSWLHRKAQNTGRFLRENGRDGVNLLREAREEHKRELKGKKLGRDMASFPYIMVPNDWDPTKPLLPEDRGGPGWIGYSQHSYETLPLPTETLTPEQVLGFRDEAYNIFYNGERHLNYLGEEFGENVVNYVKERNKKNLKRKLLGHAR